MGSWRGKGNAGAGMSYVYFLGAGFSAAYGLPVMNQFFSVARQSALLQPWEKIFLAEVQRFAHVGVRLVTISRNNMEEILSFLEMAEQAGQVPQRLTEMSKVGDKTIPPLELLRSIIARVYGPLQANRFTGSDSHLAIFGLDGCDPTPSFPPVPIRYYPPRLPKERGRNNFPIWRWSIIMRMYGQDVRGFLQTRSQPWKATGFKSKG